MFDGIRKCGRGAYNSLETAAILDPLSVRANRTFGWSYYLQRQFSNAEKWLAAALEMHAEPVQTHYLAGQVQLAQRRFGPALEQARLCQTNPPNPLTLGLLRACHATYMGQRDQALEVLTKLNRLAEADYIDPFAAGQVHIALGNIEDGLESIHQMLEEPNLRLRCSWSWTLL